MFGFFIEFFALKGLFFNSFFALNEVKVFFIASDKKIVAEDDFILIFLEFMKIIHVELDNKNKNTCLIKEGKLLWRK
jgi:hypothetical protein